jgi:hypothetical protein
MVGEMRLPSLRSLRKRRDDSYRLKNPADTCTVRDSPPAIHLANLITTSTTARST